MIVNRLEGVRHWRRFFEGNADHAARARLLRLVSLVVLGIGLIALYRATENMNIAQVLQALARLTAGQLLLAWLCTILSYLAIAGYDWSALCYIGKRVPSSVVTLDGILLLALGGSVPSGSLASAILVYRAIYYLLPLGFTLVALSCFELSMRAA